jgi:hypothetical protein
MTYAPPDAENRLKTQLTELLKLEFEVHTLGLGNHVLDGASKHFELPEHPGLLGFFWKAAIHLTMSPKHRFSKLRFPKSVVAKLEMHQYDLVVAHDLELLPAISSSSCAPSAFESALRQVDLHELHEFTAPASGILGFFWHVLKFRLLPYHEWLFSQLQSDRIGLVTVVNKSIGDWYVQNGHIKSFEEIRNAAPFVEISLEPRDALGIKYLYHGKFAPKRGLENLVEASLNMNPGDSLTFMLTGDRGEIETFKRYAFDRNPRILFHPPVPMKDVSVRIAAYDVEIIYFEPVTKNLYFTLPNKFFEAIQGRLAILSGPSPEIVRHIDEIRNGSHFKDWGSPNLASAIRGLNRELVEKLRRRSHLAASNLNAQTEGKKLRQIWTQILESTPSA